jgi:hypothetical protein
MRASLAGHPLIMKRSNPLEKCISEHCIIFCSTTVDIAALALTNCSNDSTSCVSTAIYSENPAKHKCENPGRNKRMKGSKHQPKRA